MFGKIEAVLFDLDETLLDAQIGLAKAHERIVQLVSSFLREREIHVDLGALNSKVKLLDDRMNRESRYDRDLWWPVLAVEIESRLVFPENFVHRLTAEYWKVYSQHSPPYLDTVPTLTYLKQRRYSLGLVTDTDGSPGFKTSRINKLAFRDLFSVVVVAGEDTVELKPSPAPFLKASKMLDVSTEVTVYVGDKPFTDIEGAKAAGMRTIHVLRREWDSTVKADLTIKTLAELRNIL